MSVRPPSPAELADQWAITEVLHRYCRGLDRMDRELALSCWHPGGTDSHAPLYDGSAEGFIDWLWPVHQAMSVTRHIVTNVLIDLDGDKAGSECCWTLTLRIPSGDDVYDLSGGGRYIDRFEKIDGVWAIRHRLSVREWSRSDIVEGNANVGHLNPLLKPHRPGIAQTFPARDKSDPSYAVIGKLLG